MKYALAVVLLFLSYNIHAQTDLPEDYFSSPLEVPLLLSGTFGELRSNHFHSGLDLKTQQREGLPVHAAAEGYISRINISHYGYGKALYIKHPNGFTTVYAHLKEFAPEIKAFIKKLQYEKETYEIEVFPAPDELPVAHREIIAQSGNTGGSGGPHLHFEIRDREQRPMNPLLFGYQVEDTRDPLVYAVFAYPQGPESHVDGSAARQELRLYQQNDGSYTTETIRACGKIGFGVATVDQLNGASNRNGVFRIQAAANGEQLFQTDFEIFSFSETRRINQLIDYGYYTRHDQRVQKLFVHPSNPLSIYSNLHNRGFLNVQDSLTYLYTIRITDFAGNDRIIRIPVEGKFSQEIVPAEPDTTRYFVAADQETLFGENGIYVRFPEHSLYEDAHLDIAFQKDRLVLHEDVIPVHRDIHIGFDISHYPPEQWDQLFIAALSDDGTPGYSYTERNGSQLNTTTRSLGTFMIMSDTMPPSVSPVNFWDGRWISNHETLKVRVDDDLTGIRSYRATVNGKFILMEYEYKENLLTYHFSDGMVTDKENKLKVEVTDNVGNTFIFESTFYRK